MNKFLMKKYTPRQWLSSYFDDLLKKQTNLISMKTRQLIFYIQLYKVSFKRKKKGDQLKLIVIICLIF